MNETEGISPTQPPITPTPQQSRYMALVRELTNASAILVVKVATCKCEKKENCKIYLQAHKIATIIDQLQEIGAGEGVGRVPTAKEGRVKGGQRRRNL